MSFTCDLLLYWILAALVVLPANLILPAIALTGLVIFCLGFFAGLASGRLANSTG